jgi:hypothetical protein
MDVAAVAKALPGALLELLLLPPRFRRWTCCAVVGHCPSIGGYVPFSILKPRVQRVWSGMSQFPPATRSLADAGYSPFAVSVMMD